MTDYNEYKGYHHHHHACEYIVPIKLKVPIFLEPEVVGMRPVCHQMNGYKAEAEQYVGEQRLTAQAES
ncbi:MAG TPA: hypothetical protein V6C85_32840 [Allocoleopsis sp.]